MSLNNFIKTNKEDKEKVLKLVIARLKKDKKLSDLLALREAETIVFKPENLEKIKIDALKNIGLRPGITFYFDNIDDIKVVAKYFNVNFSVMGVDNSSLLIDIFKGLGDNVVEKVGYDLDGVICNSRNIEGISYRKLNGEQRKKYIQDKITHYNNAKLLITPVEEEFYIITGRSEKYEAITMAWLERNNIRPVELFINKVGGQAQDHIKHKADLINKLGITKYYEDSKRIYSALKKLCLNTKIIFVEEKV